MDSSDEVAEPVTPTRTIGVRIPADFEDLALLRAVTETVALFADFAMDQVVDIRLAVEEVATALVQDSVRDTELDCAFEYDRAGMRVRVAAVTNSDKGPDEGGMGWHIVSTLTDSLTTSVDPYDSALGGHRAIIEFCCTAAVTDGR
ncbi:anti-sigma factor [Nocardia wallacei]|uniref:ATP-binding protein n=1 Tax=Nocardia TaxID=1817 RepID=UPI00245764A4|nr:anti-sigma factor [Nocardia wallacei]